MLRKHGVLDQRAEFLVDDALFSDSSRARIEAINMLAQEYGLSAISLITEIQRSLPPSEDVFRGFCNNVISDIIQKHEESLLRLKSEQQPCC